MIYFGQVYLCQLYWHDRTQHRRDCDDRGNELWWCGNLSWKNFAFVQKLQKQIRRLGTSEGNGRTRWQEYKDTAIREVKEETGATATIIQYVGKSQYSFTVPGDTVEKEVHWYLMMGESYYSKPQREEYFVDSGFYKYHEAYHLLKFSNEKQILEKAYNEYLDLKKSNLWGTHKYY